MRLGPFLKNEIKEVLLVDNERVHQRSRVMSIIALTDHHSEKEFKWPNGMCLDESRKNGERAEFSFEGGEVI